eukprot:SAG31_NODE_9882_length_1216_cov_2.336616_3_plen_220_part_00
MPKTARKKGKGWDRRVIMTIRSRHHVFTRDRRARGAAAAARARGQRAPKIVSAEARCSGPSADRSAASMLARTRGLSRVALRAAATTSPRSMSGTAFGGDMARLYLNFFNEAGSAWEKTDAVVADALAASGSEPPLRIIDVASGPGEPALTLAKTYPSARVLVTDAAEVRCCFGLSQIWDTDPPMISNTSGVPVLNSGRRRPCSRSRTAASPSRALGTV